jgi:hypothetical protein
MTLNSQAGRRASTTTWNCVRRFGILFVVLLFGGLGDGGVPPPNANVTISGLATKGYAANNWSGFTTPATTIAVGGDALKYIQSQSNVTGQMLAVGASIWRDEEITSYTSRGTFFLRLSGGNGLYFTTVSNSVNLGIVTGFDPTNPDTSGKRYGAFFEPNASGCITNWPTSGLHSFTFGARGFNVYLKIDGG